MLPDSGRNFQYLQTTSKGRKESILLKARTRFCLLLVANLQKTFEPIHDSILVGSGDQMIRDLSSSSLALSLRDRVYGQLLQLPERASSPYDTYLPPTTTHEPQSIDQRLDRCTTLEEGYETSHLQWLNCRPGLPQHPKL